MQRHVGLPRPPYGEVDDLLFCWEAHRIALGGCDMLLLAIACMQPGEWRDWERSAVSALRASLAACGFAEGSIDAYLFFGGIPVVTRTHGRRPVAFMNVLVDKLLPLALPLPSDEGEPFPHELCRLANERMACKAAREACFRSDDDASTRIAGAMPPRPPSFETDGPDSETDRFGRQCGGLLARPIRRPCYHDRRQKGRA